MQRKYTYIKDFEKELIEYIEQGHTLRETGEKYGFTYKEMRDFKTRYNKNQRKLAVGIALKPKGRPRKNALDKRVENDLIAELQRLKEENQYLRAENEYIKKLSALIAADEQKKSKKQK